MYLAYFRPEDVAVIIVPLAFIAIPIVRMMTKHQQQMAALFHGRESNTQLEAQVQHLQGEVQRLQAQVAQLALNAASSKSLESNLANRSDVAS